MSPARGRGRAALRAALPIAVSGALLLALLARVDLGAALERVDAGVAARLGAALLAYVAVSLGLEGWTLGRLVPGLSARTCARIKAATYPLALTHYALGVASLAYLLRRHSRLGAAAATGTVLLVSVLDLGFLLLLALLGAAFQSAGAPGLRVAVAAAALGALGAGLAFVRGGLRIPGLERLRGAGVLLPLRDASLPLLLELGALRLAFVVTFVGLCAAALAAFGVRPPAGALVVDVALVALVGALPIAVAGIGTTQAAFVYLFGAWGSADQLLACSLALSAGILALRASLGLAFAREFTREALRAPRAAEGTSEPQATP
jgi:hypothetical protein